MNFLLHRFSRDSWCLSYFLFLSVTLVFVFFLNDFILGGDNQVYFNGGTRDGTQDLVHTEHAPYH